MNESTVRELLLRQMGELQDEEKIITDMEPVQAPAVTLGTPVLSIFCCKEKAAERQLFLELLN